MQAPVPCPQEILNADELKIFLWDTLKSINIIRSHKSIDQSNDDIIGFAHPILTILHVYLLKILNNESH